MKIHHYVLHVEYHITINNIAKTIKAAIRFELSLLAIIATDACANQIVVFITAPNASVGLSSSVS